MYRILLQVSLNATYARGVGGGARRGWCLTNLSILMHLIKREQKGLQYVKSRKKDGKRGDKKKDTAKRLMRAKHRL